ncbi:hypothetical protein BASA81_010763 [Batrachochytrium salamandrivorans]|nr:hypothetical protein BASA81_010763 [Batrachochytrium salamandrivorans]
MIVPPVPQPDSEEDEEMAVVVETNKTAKERNAARWKKAVLQREQKILLSKVTLSLYWTRQYNAKAAQPRPHAWSDVSKQILQHAMYHHSCCKNEAEA